jgi:hypothetical protein
MLKRLSILLMLASVLNQTFSTVETLVAFQMNREYIAQMLCINRDKPTLHCDGKCVMMQRMQIEVNKASEKGQQLLRNLIEHDVVLFFENTRILIFEPKTESNPCNNPPIAYLQYKPQPHLRGVFHPPTAI